MRTLDLFRPSVGAFAVGMAQAALDAGRRARRRARGVRPHAERASRRSRTGSPTSPPRVQAARLLVHQRRHRLRRTASGRSPRPRRWPSCFATETAQEAVDVADPGPRRTRARAGPPARAPVPRGAGAADLRGRLGDPARDHRPRALPRRRVGREGPRRDSARRRPSLGVMATVTLETRAAALLADLAGPDATFRPHQLEAIRDLVEDRARVLCVQRTGWGKSAVYFVATALLRERGAGPTLLVSPLLALMRNQIEAAERLGIRAHTINSTNRDEWDEVQRAARGGRGRPAADQPRAARQPAVPRRRAAAARRAGRAARDRRGALHLRLGPRLPARLPAARGDPRAAAGGRAGAVHDGDGQRPRRRRRRRAAAARARAARCGPTAARSARSSLRLEVVDLPGAGRPAGLARDVAPAARRARASSTRSPCATPSSSPTG